MGMQCFFNLADAEHSGDFLSISKCADGEDGSLNSVVIRADHCDYAFNFIPGGTGGSCWFDIGQMRPLAIRKLEMLIRYRIPFSCS